MVTHTGEILYTAATDKNNAVLLKVVANAGDIGTDFNTVRKSYSGDLSERGVRLFGGSCLDSGANASLLGGVLVDSNSLLGVPALQKCRSLCLLFRKKPLCPYVPTG